MVYYYRNGYFGLHEYWSMKRTFVFCLSLVVILFCAVNTFALKVRVNGNRLSVHADQVPLQEILERLSNLGIRISIQPQLNPKISASFEDWEIQKGINSILKSYNHILVWDIVEGPLGPISRLSEIQVFLPGKKERMRSFDSKHGLSVARNPKDGSLFVKDEILLRIKPGTRLLEVKRLLARIGGTVIDSNASLGIYKIRLRENSNVSAIIEQVGNHPGVSASEPNYVYPISLLYKSSTTAFKDDGFSNNLVPEGNVPIAILDTGLKSNTGLEEFVLASFDALNPDEQISDPLGHGTQMALIAAGVVKPYGVKRDLDTRTPIIPIKAFDSNGFTSNFSIMRSVNFAVNNGARVMSLSWGTEIRSEFLEQSIEFASAKGLIIVASVGNEPTGKPVYPAAYPSVVGVGALRSDGKSWEKSNYGDFVELYAPGFASLPVGYEGDPGVYGGTSISAAYMANIIAEYISQKPEATKQEILDALRVR